MSKQSSNDHKSNSIICAEKEPEFVSPIAQPLLNGTLLERSIRLLKKAVLYEQHQKEEGISPKGFSRRMMRGVAEVTKSIRKGQKGIVFLASDVYPIEIIAHFPVFCENNGVPYCFVGNKRMLGSACHTKRSTSVVMLCSPSSELPYCESYQKVYDALKKIHPYF